MTIQQKLEGSGITPAELARRVGVSPAEIYQWRKGIRPVPVERCADIERATNGQISRRDLRPNDWQRIWPELAPMTEAAAGQLQCSQSQDHNHA